MSLQPIALLAGDCLDQIPMLPDQSINAVITSPPYARQRVHQYGGIPEEEYPEWFVSVMDAIKPKLKPDGSIIVNIRSHVKDGAVSDYVLRTRLALRDAGWIENEELIWHKPDSAPLGSVHRPRRNYENILWFSTCKNPAIDLRAAGFIAKNRGSGGFHDTKKAHQFPGLYGRFKNAQGNVVAKVSDVITVPINGAARNNPHPAAFPPALAYYLIQTFSAIGDVILDPFAGSGTTMLVARALDRASIGIERMARYRKLIEKRIAKIDWAGIDAIRTHSPVGWYRVNELFTEADGRYDDESIKILNELLEERRKELFKFLK